MEAKQIVYNRRAVADLIKEVALLWGEQSPQCYIDEQLKIWSNTIEKQKIAFACFLELKNQALAIRPKPKAIVKGALIRCHPAFEQHYKEIDDKRITEKQRLV